MSTLVPPATHRNIRGLASTGAFAVTAVRAPVGLTVLVAVITGHAVLGAIALSLFVGLDVMDGVIARRACIDDAYRRGLDSLIDRVMVVAFFLDASLHMVSLLPSAIAILTVNLIALPLALTTWRKHRVVIKAPQWHKIWSLLAFLAGLLYFADLMVVPVTAIAAIAMTICTSQLCMLHKARPLWH